MPKYWESDPNHYTEWGEKGGLPVDPRTIHKTYNATGRALTDTDRDLVRVNIRNMTINATERQKQREIRDGMTPRGQ